MLIPGFDSDVIVFDEDFRLEFVMTQGKVLLDRCL
jgi:N-acetylglucosamine-6-phosphate deacetylase